MNKLSKQLILLLTIISLNIFAQVKLEANQLKMSYKWDVKYPFKISNIDSSKLSPNDYIITHRDKKGLGFILLSIDDNNNIKNPIVIKNNQREIIAKLYLESSNIIKRELFNTYSNQLEEEKKILNDTIYEKQFDEFKKLTQEYRYNIENKLLYLKSYAYDKEGVLKYTREQDKILGVYRSYDNKTGIIEESGDGILKMIYSNGYFKIIKGNKISEYNKEGKLIKSYIEEEEEIAIPPKND